MAETLKKAVAYARFSSDMQRDESIDAQVRAITEYVRKSGYVLHKIYADRGISGTTDNRPEFQKMIEDVKKGGISAVIVHKFDRFARNRADSAIYRRELEKCNVKLISVLENFDESPESIILQSVIEGYNEYYSKNLRREVMKGLKENALTCRFTGGIPPLGYDINKDTLKYEINTFEAEAVRLIFKMYLEGYGYTAIINELNRRSFTTKRGKPFGKNSIFDILKNEKYSGIYIYNKTVPVGADGKWNRHQTRSEDEIIRIEGGIPQIISKEDFQKVQQKMAERKHKAASYKAKQEYLLSGKIRCGNCGSTYCGNSRKTNGSLYISYTCVKKNGSVKCKNPGIKRDVIEQLVLEKLSTTVFSEDVLPTIISNYNEYALGRNTEYTTIVKELKQKISDTERGISNIVELVVSTGSSALTEKLKELEATQQQLTESLMDAEHKISQLAVNEKKIKSAFYKAKQMLKSGTLKNQKAIIEKYVKRITIYEDRIEIEYTISDTYSFKETVSRQ